MNANAPVTGGAAATQYLEPDLSVAPDAVIPGPARASVGSQTETPSPAVSLLDQILAAAVVGAERPLATVQDILRPLIEKASAHPQARTDLNYMLGAVVARIDRLISGQVNQILHHPSFQQLESSWRGLRFLLEGCDPEEGVQVKILNASWTDLARDTEMAIEFDQTALFRKVYDEEFGMAGGEPFGVLIGDYQIRHNTSREHPVDDIAVLTMLSQVATAAFCPFIGGCHPNFLGLESFSGLQRPLNLAQTFDQPEYLRWRAFRETEEARFVGLTLPRVLMRLPYEEDQLALTPFEFREDVHTPGGENYLWGNAAWAFASVLVRAFTLSRWMSDIRGVRRGEEGAGIVPGLPSHSFETDMTGVAARFSTDVAITDLQDRSLADLGLIPLAPCKDTPYCAFYSNQSVQKAKVFGDAAASANAQISAMLQYVFCASRIAHYLKVIGRDRIGSFKEAAELTRLLSDWLNKYTMDDANASADKKAAYPLRGAEVTVREQPGKPGSFFCDMLLQPHSQWDELAVGIKLVTELAPPRSG